MLTLTQHILYVQTDYVVKPSKHFVGKLSHSNCEEGS